MSYLHCHRLTFPDVGIENGGDAPIAGEAPSADGKVELRAAALDAYRVSGLYPAMHQVLKLTVFRYSTTFVS